MPSVKLCITSILFIASLLTGAKSFAFDVPKEFDEFKSIGSNVEVKSDFNSVSSLENNSNEIKLALLSAYSEWKGTRYHWGGTTKNGVDCSALIQHIFSDSLNKKIPRTTVEQIKKGSGVNKKNLKAGDLVFFKTSPDDRHVGVYVGDNHFIHASKMKGVTISSLDNKYWLRHYETARRLKLTS